MDDRTQAFPYCDDLDPPHERPAIPQPPQFRCACPVGDARSCIAIRYGRDRWCDDPTEPCECACHDDVEDDDDDW